MSTAANRVAIFLSSVLCSFQKCTWPKIAEDTVTHWSRIVAIIASIFLIVSVNPVSNPQMVQRRGALISGWKSTTFKTQTLEKKENLRLLQNWEEQCSMQSLVNLYSLKAHCRATYPAQFRWINPTWKLSRPPGKFTPSWRIFKLAGKFPDTWKVFRLHA